MNVNEIKELVAAFDQSNLKEITWEKDDFMLRLRKPEPELSGAACVPDEIKELVAAFDQSNLKEMMWEKDDFVLKLKKPEPVLADATCVPNESQVVTEVIVNGEAVSPVTAPVADQAPAVEVPDQKKRTSVVAPLVGVFYRSSAPEVAPFVEVGAQVSKGETVCIIEAMKVLNEIKAPVSGQVLQIHVNNGDVVEFDQVLMEIGD